MGDYVIRASFTANCEPGEVRRWLASTAGIAGWWSDTVEGSAEVAGDSFSVRFPTTDVVFQLEVEDSTADLVRWQVPESPPWWKDTTISFELGANDGGGSTILFTHSGFSPDDPIIAVITPAWVRFLDNLVAVSESGRANPAVIN